MVRTVLRDLWLRSNQRMMMKTLTQFCGLGHQEVLLKEYHSDVASVVLANILLGYANENVIGFVSISSILLVQLIVKGGICKILIIPLA